MLAGYSDISRAGEGSGPTLPQAEELYSIMCDSRKVEIADALVEWEAELGAAAEAERTDAADARPARHLIRPAAEDRMAGYSHEIAKRLAGLVKVGIKIAVRKEDAIALRHTPPRGQ